MFNKEVMRSQIVTGILSDHNVTMISAELRSEKRGPGLWRFNNELLQCQIFVESVREESEKARSGLGIYSGALRQGVKVELLLSSIRVIAIKRSRVIARENRLEEQSLYSAVSEMDARLAVRLTRRSS